MVKSQMLIYKFPVNSPDNLLAYAEALVRAEEALRTKAQLADEAELEEIDDDLELIKALKFTLQTMYHMSAIVRS